MQHRQARADCACAIKTSKQHLAPSCLEQDRLNASPLQAAARDLARESRSTSTSRASPHETSPDSDCAYAGGTIPPGPSPPPSGSQDPGLISCSGSSTTAGNQMSPMHSMLSTSTSMSRASMGTGLKAPTAGVVKEQEATAVLRCVRLPWGDPAGPRIHTTPSGRLVQLLPGLEPVAPVHGTIPEEGEGSGPVSTVRYVCPDSTAGLSLLAASSTLGSGDSLMVVDGVDDSGENAGGHGCHRLGGMVSDDQDAGVQMEEAGVEAAQRFGRVTGKQHPGVTAFDSRDAWQETAAAAAAGDGAALTVSPERQGVLSRQGEERLAAGGSEVASHWSPPPAPSTPATQELRPVQQLDLMTPVFTPE